MCFSYALEVVVALMSFVVESVGGGASAVCGGGGVDSRDREERGGGIEERCLPSLLSVGTWREPDTVVTGGGICSNARVLRVGGRWIRHDFMGRGGGWE
jgi:hypothetical protein